MGSVVLGIENEYFSSVSSRRHSRGTSPSSASRRHVEQRALKCLLSLYAQRNTWKPYGNIKVICGGCLLVSPVNLWWWIVELSMVVTVIVFAYEFFFFNWIVLVPAIITAVLECFAFYTTCLRDPGVQPRGPFLEAFKNCIEAVIKWELHQSENLTKLITHSSGVAEQYHYCWKCQHYRSLSFNTTHCRECDCCMIQHDHHCPVIGMCVAKNNLTSFQTMVVTIGGFWAYTIGFCIYKMASSPENFIRPESAIEVEEQQYAAAQLTIYVILGGVAAVIIVPVIVNMFRLCCSRKSTSVQSMELPQQEQISEFLKFVRENIGKDEEAKVHEWVRICNLPSETEASEPEDLTNHNAIRSA